MRFALMSTGLACAAALAACATPMEDGMGEDGMSSGSMSGEAAASGSMSGGGMSGSMEGHSMVGGAAMYPNRNIVENAQNSPIHKTLVAAVVRAQLADTLSGEGPFTVFAPTDAAFNAVPASARASLMQDANRAQLRSVLTYHVVPGRLTAADLTARVRAGDGTATLTTVQGGTLTVRQEGDRLTITDATGARANVTQGDVLQSNGVIHVIDRVLMAG